jgi:hypothetical protein
MLRPNAGDACSVVRDTVPSLEKNTETNKRAAMIETKIASQRTFETEAPFE